MQKNFNYKKSLYTAKILEGNNPYELWKKQIVVPKDTVYVDENKDRKYEFD